MTQNASLIQRLIRTIQRAYFGRYTSRRGIARVAALLEVPAQDGDAQAAYWLATMNWEGWVIPQDAQRGSHFFHAAAKLGSRPALYNLGVAYDNGLYVSKNKVKAFSYFMAAAKLGETEAMHAVGSMLSLGEGVERDLKKGKYWFLQSAKRGFAAAMYAVGSCYQKGEGTKQNTRLALRWFEAALAGGETKPLTGLGYCFYKLVSPPDFSRARTYFEQAREFDYPNATYNLGIMAEKGYGQPALWPDALFWYAKAADLGHEGAKLKVAELQGEIF